MCPVCGGDAYLLGGDVDWWKCRGCGIQFQSAYEGDYDEYDEYRENQWGNTQIVPGVDYD